MTVALFDTAQIGAVANAIRAKDGDATPMTVAQMPARIEPLLTKNYREIWLHGPKQLKNLVIDTGVPGSMEHTLEVVGYGNIYDTTVLFGSITSSQSRQMFDMLTTSMKFRFAWGNSGLQTYTYDISTIIPWHPVTVRFNKNGFTLNGFTSSYNPSEELTGDYSALVTGGESTANYCISPQAQVPTRPVCPEFSAAPRCLILAMCCCITLCRFNITTGRWRSSIK